ncbi:hypothetical protein VTN77DRAFT_2568 [Rasamsonia byssochlamydoides]|uniref:uncharacterized protein n=1 Tax=Rasamsonia byssochlamydoides TaxID=89139 RepID=UPI00374260B7
MSERRRLSSSSSIFGGVPDVLFQILSVGDVSAIPLVCRLNRATYHTIKFHEAQICTSYLRHHHIPPFDPVLMMDRATGQPCALTICNLQKFLQRQETARQLASRIARSGWGAWWAIKNTEMDDEADLFRQRVERGLYVMLHMADIIREVERTKPPPDKMCPISLGVHRYLVSLRLPCALESRKKGMCWLPRHVAHIYRVLVHKAQHREIGKRRLIFRQYLDEEREIDFHIALQMLRLFLDTILFAHSPDDGNVLSEDCSIMCWFLLRQPAHALSRIFLELPEAKCCSVEDRARKDSFVCNYAEELKEYWDAWNGDTHLDCKRCEAMLRSWSVDVILNDRCGQKYDRQAREWVRQMRGEGESPLD